VKICHIRDVIAVAESGSLRAASRKLGITQPSITRSIRDTENELGLSLFTRRSNGVSLTEAGRLFVQRATSIQSEFRRIHEEMEQVKGNFVGSVSMVIETAASVALVPLALAAFQKEHPHAVINMTEGLFPNYEREIVAGEIDFYVGPFDAGGLKTPLSVEKLFDSAIAVVGRRNHPLRHATRLEELRDARWIRPAFPAHGSESVFDRIFERDGLPAPEIVMRSRSAMTTLLAVANSDMLTLLPEQLLDSPMTGEQVERFPLSQDFRAPPVCIVRRNDVPLTPLAERFSDLMRKAGHNYARSVSAVGQAVPDGASPSSAEGFGRGVTATASHN